MNVKTTNFHKATDVALAVQPIEGIGWSARLDLPNFLNPMPGGTHGAIPERTNLYAGFLAQGAGIRQGLALPIIGMEDIAPLIAMLLGIDFNAPDGVLYPGILKTFSKP